LSAILGRDLSSWCEPVESHSGIELSQRNSPSIERDPRGS
jgi:hypothetical protein